ncbi:MAG: 23S rRNA (adenine(2030)-N(6))-methyltransferase RlmJ [Alphaproteobacteria bacterium]|jgi:23S rRNA (adenine2030-N6)-methyltransferase|nr:23S rRNA (adenine(2030)-N(6))-methyltransferase RlmJ [Alphaproteobacteria bacterium]OJU58095.1 MAG: hypothetical protein BGO00_02010 [Alphaproteobacteria bacterium 62-8]
MNYRHAYHAGNFADVVKHLALLAVLLHLRKKASPFAVIDSHAGRGLYDLRGEAALRTGEAAAGIGRLLQQPAGLPPLLEYYLDVVRAAGDGRYPGSPWLAAHLLRDSDRLIAIEKHPEELAALADVLSVCAHTRAVAGDGYARLPGLLPPRERRGTILIDPPFEKDDEFARAAQTFAHCYSRFATGIYLLWFPLKTSAQAESFMAEILNCGVRKALRLDIEVAGAGDGEKSRLRKAGLVIVNPPFGFDAQMQEAGAALADRLGPDARLSLVWLAGEGL